MIKDAVKEVFKIHRYKVTSKYWKRVGVMHSRYGEATLLEAIQSIKPQEIPLEDILNMIEKRCQFILENGEMDDLSKMLLN